jgi:transcription antitermination factor NusG
MGLTTKIDALGTTANVTDDREARSFHWYAARTQMNCERKAEKEFKNIALETYLPVQEEIHKWSDRKKIIQRVVIPMIVFVKMDSQEVKKVRHSSSFYGFISHDRHDLSPALIPDKDIDILRFMLGHSDSPVTVEPLPLKLGDRVRVVRGGLKGLEGFVISCKSGLSTVIVKLNLLGCAKVSINQVDLERA